MSRSLFQRLALSLLFTAAQAYAADSIKTKTTYQEAYGTTKNSVSVDPSKDLPRYPALAPSAALKSWKIKEGFELQLAAHEPLVRDPVAICFDERGRMFVCEMIDYPEFRDAQPHLGRISMLEDCDGDGHFEKATVFADDLPWPTGLIWANNGLYVAATPDIFRFEDRDGDGKAEIRRRIFTGFGTGLKILNVQGMLNSLQWGLDNRVHLLGGSGNRGEIQSVEHPEIAAEEIGSRDFWFDPLTHAFGFETGGAQYGMSYDAYGRKYGCSNSDHLQHWVYSPATQRSPFFPMPAARRSIAVDGGAAEVFRISPDEPWRIIRTRWRVAGTVPGSVEGGGRVSGYFTGATGTTIYKGDAFGPDFVNNSFTGDAGGQLVHRKKIRTSADGVNLEGERPEDEHGFEFAASNDTWVRVVNFANAPDGCLYICDMYREVIEHPWSIPDEIKRHINLHSGEDRGRVYRIAPKQGAKRIGEKVELATADTTTLIATLGHANGWHRETAHRLLIERHPKDALAGLGELLVHGTDVAKLHALGVLEGLHALSAKQITGALDDKHWAVRERALRLAGQHAANQTLHSSEERAQLAKKIATLADDKVTRVRFELALTLAALLEKRQDSELDVALLKLAEHDYANPWIAPALLSAPPEQIVRTLFDPIKKQTRSSSDGSLLAFQAQLTEMKAAIVPEETRVALIRELTEGAPNTALLRALGDGLKRAGTTLEKADIEKRLGPIFTRAIADLQSNSASESASISAIELLKLAPAATALPAIETCLRESAPASVQSAAINAVAKISPNSAAQRLLSHWKKLHPAAQSAAVAALTDRDNNTLALLNAIKENTVSAQSLSSTQIQGILKSKNAEITNLAKTALAAVLPQSRAEAVTKYTGSLAAKGDAHNGKSQFMQRCQVCHQAAGAGIQVGPDLVTVKTKGRDALLSAILEPNKEVATAYIVYQVETKEGQTLQGFISEDNADALTLKMAGGVTQTIKRSQIKGTSSGGQSLMPEGIETGMSVQEMADLLTFIETLP